MNHINFLWILQLWKCFPLALSSSGFQFNVFEYIFYFIGVHTGFGQSTPMISLATVILTMIHSMTINQPLV